MASKSGEANFFPEVPVFPSMGTFQPVYSKFDLTTYIQGASDYEIMAFLVGKYNACLEAYGTITKLSTDTITACKQLQDWINSWFDNLDVQEELNKKIDSMVADGSFERLLHQTFDAQINRQTTSAVTAWLVANVTPTGSAVVVDKSLSVAGAAADAKEAGKALIGSVNVYNATTAAKYPDLNTVPCNRVILFTNRNTYDLANAPAEQDGLFYSVALETKNANEQTAIIQYYATDVAANPNNFYTRIKFGPTKWSDWTSYKNITDNLTNKAILGSVNVYNANTAAKYPDLNTVPCNRVILFTNRNTYDLANAPAEQDGLFYSVALETKNANEQTAIIQYYATDVAANPNNFYTRIKFGPTKWSDWTSYKNITDNLTNKAILGSVNVYNANTAAKYPDLNTVPCNRVILFTNRNTYDLANAPTVNDGLFYSIARDVNDPTGYVQYYITTTNMWRRVKWGTTFRAWINMDSAQSDSSDYMPSSIAQFIRLGVVGDSYASGEIVLPPDYNFIDYYNLSWGQCIARRNGITCTNYSGGGLTTRTWLTSKKGQTLLTSSAPDNLYLLALGINDANKLGLDYLGSIEDIKSDYNQNADTFYGNYGKIISIIMAKSSTAKIVMLDLANDNNSSLYNTYNTAIKEIAKHFGIPCIHENDDAFFNSAFYKNKSYGHPTATTYGGMAVAIERLFAKCCVDNVNYFRNYIG